MLLYRFHQNRGGRVALTIDEAGENLPEIAGSWKSAGTESIGPNDGPRIGASSADIVAGVEEKGYFLWPQTDE